MQPDTLHSLHFGAGLWRTLWCRAIVQGGLFGGQSGPWTPLVGWCGHVHRAPTHPSPDSPLLQSSGGCSRRPRCVWPPVWPRLCLVSALPALPQLLACSPYPCPPAADLVPDLHLPWCLVQPVQLLPGDIQLRPLLLGDPSFPESFSKTLEHWNWHNNNWIT